MRERNDWLGLLDFATKQFSGHGAGAADRIPHLAQAHVEAHAQDLGDLLFTTWLLQDSPPSTRPSSRIGASIQPVMYHSREILHRQNAMPNDTWEDADTNRTAESAVRLPQAWNLGSVRPFN